jgi:hypothetical protein
MKIQPHHNHGIHGAHGSHGAHGPKGGNAQPASQGELHNWLNTALNASGSASTTVQGGTATANVNLNVNLNINFDQLLQGINLSQLGGGLSGNTGIMGQLNPLGDLGHLFNPPNLQLPPSIMPGGCFPCPPPAKALTTEVPGFPAGSVKTAGGYVVVPEGKDAAWSIYSPGQKAGDKPMSRIWGDPHVNEQDGTRWDFTKNSNFRLPDGTTISVDTTSQTGQSVTKGLNITNGADHVSITGIDGGKPQTSAVQYDGFRYRASAMGDRQEFVLGKADGKSVEWFRQDKNGQIEGLITGSSQDAQKTYDQTLQKTDASGKPFQVDPSLSPPIGSKAWEKVFGNEIKDLFNKYFPELAKGDDDAGRRAETAPRFPHIGGDLGRFFERPLSDAFGAIRDMGNLINQLSWLTQVTDSGGGKPANYAK